MKTDCREQLVFLNIVVPRQLEDKVLCLLGDYNVHMTSYMLGRGTASAGYVMRLFGLVVEHKKVLVSGITTGEIARDIMQALVTKCHFDRPNTGIAFTVPVKKLSY